jgi:hypothetical protein
MLTGLGRVLALTGTVCALCVGLGLLIGHFKHTPPSRSLPISLYIGGAVLMLGTLGGALPGRTIYRTTFDHTAIHDEMARRFQPGRGIYVAGGVLLIAFGVVLDWLL